MPSRGFGAASSRLPRGKSREGLGGLEFGGVPLGSRRRFSRLDVRLKKASCCTRENLACLLRFSRRGATQSLFFCRLGVWRFVLSSDTPFRRREIWQRSTE